MVNAVENLFGRRPDRTFLRASLSLSGRAKWSHMVANSNMSGNHTAKMLMTSMMEAVTPFIAAKLGMRVDGIKGTWEKKYAELIQTYDGSEYTWYLFPYHMVFDRDQNGNLDVRMPNVIAQARSDAADEYGKNVFPKTALATLKHILPIKRRKRDLLLSKTFCLVRRR